MTWRANESWTVGTVGTMSMRHDGIQLGAVMACQPNLVTKNTKEKGTQTQPQHNQ
eukprot:m.281837 g.281837  ORF g.281837 m.281837 type:complete len:55 (+) comp15754_c0_seq8:2346-2510(+)